MQPSSPDPQFDFMLKNSQPAKKGLPLPRLPKVAKIILAVVLGILLLVIISSVLSGRNKGSSQGIIGALARGQEISRVTTLTQQQLHLQDPETQALASTVSATLASDNQQLTSYLATNGTKVSKVILATDTDKSTDAQLQTASQNNSLDDAYRAYLKVNLAKYATNLQSAYKSAGPKGKAILKDSYESVQSLLSTSILSTQ